MGIIAIEGDSPVNKIIDIWNE